MADKIIAAGLEWRDTSSYSRDDKNKVPDCFTTDPGDLSITVLSGHIYHKGEWIMHCHALGFSEYVLGVKTFEEAAEKALLICKKKVDLWAAALKNISSRT